MNCKRGEIYYADLSGVIGSEQGGLRPVLIVQNDKGNLHSTTTIVAAITSKKKKNRMPTHVNLEAKLTNLVNNSVVECEQLRTIDTVRLKRKLAELDSTVMEKIDQALLISLSINGGNNNG